MITIGLMQLDEDHTGTMDLKKNLKDFISEQNKELYMRKRLAARRHFAKRAGIVIIAVILAFCSHTLLFSGQEIHTDVYKRQALQAARPSKSSSEK